MYDRYQKLRFENNYKSKDDISEKVIKCFDERYNFFKRISR